ncbi:MAG: hypothetical protein EXR72_15785 [Myxococcales bacterium]|nr:hypothetical protein [Myxococcales bacterium]
MRHPFSRSAAAAATLLSFLSLSMAPSFARADDEGPEAPRPSQPIYIPPPPPLPLPQVESPYPPPQYAPPPYYVAPQQPRPRYEEQPRIGLAIAGFTVFGGLYMLNAMSGYINKEGWFAAPVIGPWAYIATYRSRFDCPSTQGYCRTEDSNDRFVYMLLVLDGLLQAGSLAMGIAGVLTKRRVAVYDRPRVSILPSVNAGGAGLAALGTF